MAGRLLTSLDHSLQRRARANAAAAVRENARLADQRRQAWLSLPPAEPAPRLTRRA
jgi:hypothetical protein